MISPILRFIPLLYCLLFAATAPAAPLREPLYQTPPADLMTPATGNLYEIPVVSICYLPTRDGVRLDPDATDLDASLYQMCQLPLSQAERLVIPIPMQFPTQADDNRLVDISGEETVFLRHGAARYKQNAIHLSLAPNIAVRLSLAAWL